MSKNDEKEKKGGPGSSTEELMIKPISWNEFRDSGMLFFVNTILQFVGLSIVVEVEESTGEIENAYPARTKFRGFTWKAAEEGYEKFTEYIRQKTCNNKKVPEPPEPNLPPLEPLEITKPKAPLLRVLKEGDTRKKCMHCGSSLKRKWLVFLTDHCINPECFNYWKGYMGVDSAQKEPSKTVYFQKQIK